MGKNKNFVDDFLHIVNNEERDTYSHKEWSWDNLPHVEVMFEVIKRHFAKVEEHLITSFKDEKK